MTTKRPRTKATVADEILEETDEFSRTELEYAEFLDEVGDSSATVYVYRISGLHEFVLMPNHFHLLITPAESLERSLQLIKGGFSFRARKELGFVGEIWQGSFYDHSVRDVRDYDRCRDYILNNPVKRGLVASPDDYPYGSAAGFVLDKVPQRLKPILVPA